MGTESIIRKAAPWLVRRKQSLLEPLEGTDNSLRLTGKKKTTISSLTKPQKKESRKWHGSISSVRQFFSRWSSASPVKGVHPGDTQNIVVGLEDSRDGEGNGRPLFVSSPRVPNLPTPQSTQIGRPLHLNRGEDPASHHREMKLAALERAQIEEELSEAARLRGGCVPCSKGTVTLASPQGSDPGLSIEEIRSTWLTRAAGSRGEQLRSRAQSHAVQPRSRAESRTSQEPSPTSGESQTRQRSPAVEGEGPSPSGRPSQQDMHSGTTSQADSRSRRQAQKERPPRPGKPPATIQFPSIPSSAP